MEDEPLGTTHNNQAAELKNEGTQVERVVTVYRPIHELYRFWRNFENLPRVMPQLKSVKQIDDHHSQWVVRGPLGWVEWTARILNEAPEKLIAWETLEGSPVRHAGSVAFEALPEYNATRVHVTLRYEAPAGEIGKALATLTGTNPVRQLAEALRRFKQVMETGEIPTTSGQPAGRQIKIPPPAKEAAA